MVHSNGTRSRQTERTVVLLGAGSSRDAGLPLTEELARLLVEEINNDKHLRNRQVVVALNFVYGAMVAHATEKGLSPLQAVNVEKLVSAVRLLQERSSHEAAPFVASWKAAIEEVDTHPISTSADQLFKEIDRALADGRGSDRLVESIASIAREALSPGSGQTYRELETELLTRTSRLLSQLENVDYLRPVAELAEKQSGGLDVVTLNYDRTVETMAEDAGMPIDTGLGRWVPGLPLHFESRPSHVNLIKVHGSIDWGHSNHEQARAPLGTARIITGVDPKDNAKPAIVIGDRGKLEGDGPTLPLLRAFEDALARAGHLVVVGYSFGDSHIDSILRNWLLSDDNRTITVLDPGWSRARGPRLYSANKTYPLREALELMAGMPSSVVPSRLTVVRDSAKAGLVRALNERPLGLVPNELEMVVGYDEDGSYIQIMNHGYDLEEVRVFASELSPYTSMQAILGFRVTLSAPATRTVLLGTIAHGESRSLYFDRDDSHDEETGGLTIEGLTSTKFVRIDKKLNIPKRTPRDAMLPLPTD